MVFIHSPRSIFLYFCHSLHKTSAVFYRHKCTCYWRKSVPESNEYLYLLVNYLWTFCEIMTCELIYLFGHSNQRQEGGARPQTTIISLQGVIKERPSAGYLDQHSRQITWTHATEVQPLIKLMYYQWSLLLFVLGWAKVTWRGQGIQFCTSHQDTQVIKPAVLAVTIHKCSRIFNTDNKTLLKYIVSAHVYIHQPHAPISG